MKNWFPAPKQTVTAFASAAAIVVGLWVMPTLAADPFRSTDPRPIGDNTESAFDAIFRDGNYKEAERYLRQAETTEQNEPLVYALLASLAYTERDWNGLKTYASKTLQAAERLTGTDPLRGNLYTAAGHFLEGAYQFKEEGPVGALTKLQKVFSFLDEAKKIDANDPELNLLTGYMDLMLAVNLPFSDPAQAIEKLENHASPSYLAYRGIAIGYRDLKQYPKALEFVDRALQGTPNNPEVLYLKAQILVSQSKNQEALDFFRRALEKQAQLPKYSVAQITYERCKTENRIDRGSRNCDGERDAIRRGNS